MDLSDFVKQTLVQIVRGIRDANKEVAGEIAPTADKKAFLLFYSGGENPKAPHIEFDVAVTTTTTKSGKTGVSGRLWVVDAKAGGSAGASNEHISHVKFSVLVKEHQG